MRARRWAWPALFAACVVGAGIRSLTLGQDANWDLKNYHWYNGWALLNGRMGWDLAPAQVQTYLNPIGDLPLQLLVHTVPWPRAIAVILALGTAVAAFFLIRLCIELFHRENDRPALVAISAAAAIGVSGAAGQATIGATMNDWPPAAFLMAALWVAVRALSYDEPRRTRGLLLGAFLAGCAAGFKLTCGVYAVGFLAALLVVEGPGRARRVAMGALLLFAGWAVLGGYWAWHQWREFGNPLFPFFNDAFRSPWWEPIAFFDRNWGPREPLHWLFFPLYFARRSTLVSEVGFRDYRLAALLMLALLAALRWSIRRERMPASWRFLSVFTIASYAVWIKLFGIYRYLVPLELASGPLIVGCIAYLLRGRSVRIASLAIAALLLVGTTRPMSWGRIPFGERFLDVRAPELPAGSLVIMGFSHPMAYNIPFFRPDARFVSPASNFLMPGQQNLLARRIEEVIRTHPGAIFLMEYQRREGQDRNTLAHFGLAYADGPCLPIRSPLSDNFVQVCPVARAQPRAPSSASASSAKP